MFARWLAWLSCDLVRAHFDACLAMVGDGGDLVAAGPVGLAGLPLLPAVLASSTAMF